MKRELKIFIWGVAAFLIVWFLPVDSLRFENAVLEAFRLLRWYAHEHVLLCLVPAFFIAGVISVFISQGSVIRHFGADAVKWKSYGIASVSGTILAVCSCTVLPLFSSIQKRGAGIGPAITFLYSGPAINILAIILTARILGWELGLARVIGAVLFSVVIGLAMAYLFHRDEREAEPQSMSAQEAEESRPLWQTGFHFFVLVFILVFANWGSPDGHQGLFSMIAEIKWWLTGFFGLLLAYSLHRFLGIKLLHVAAAAAAVLLTSLLLPEQPLVSFVIASAALAVLAGSKEGETRDWLYSSWDFAKQILPLLAAGVFVAGLLLGTAGGEGLIPGEWVAALVGGNSSGANLFASVFGAFMYFATLTEIPILQGLLGSGMGQGPALALLLAGPALSLPNMLVIRSVLGTKKTLVFVALVILMSTASGLIYGAFSSV